MCQPLFSLAGVRIHAIFTRRANHAYRLLRNKSVDLTPYQAIGCVGGDGMFSELLNGILKRKPSTESSSPLPSSPPSPPHSFSASPTSSTAALSQQSRPFSSVGTSSPDQKKANRTFPSTSSHFFPNHHAIDRDLNATHQMRPRENFLERTNSSKYSKTAPQLVAGQTKSSTRPARPRLLVLPEHNKLGVRHSLPTVPNSAPILSALRKGKRHSLPASPQCNVHSRPCAASDGSLPPLLLVPAGSTDAVAYATNAINDPQTVLINFLLG